MENKNNKLIDFLNSISVEEFQTYVKEAKIKYGEVGVTVGEFLSDEEQIEIKKYQENINQFNLVLSEIFPNHNMVRTIKVIHAYRSIFEPEKHKEEMDRLNYLKSKMPKP